MNKNTPQKQTVADFVQLIDNELNSREAGLLTLKEELEAVRDRNASERLQIEEERASLEKEKAQFLTLKSEVDQKFSKIRQDKELSEALKAQADERKALEKIAKQADEDKKLSELNLQELGKRELALSKREEVYRDEIKKELTNQLFRV